MRDFDSKACELSPKAWDPLPPAPLSGADQLGTNIGMKEAKHPAERTARTFICSESEASLLTTVWH